jgi:vacuolar-type H+-ATPase subunit H
VAVTPDELIHEAEDAIELWFCELDHAHADLIADAETIAQQVIVDAEAQAQSLTAAARAECEDIVGAAHIQARRVLDEAVTVAERLRNEAIADVAHLRRVVATLENELTIEVADHGLAPPAGDPLDDLVDHVAVDDLMRADEPSREGAASLALSDEPTVSADDETSAATNGTRVTAVDLVAADAPPPAGVTSGNGDRHESDPTQPAKRRRGLRRLFGRSHV